MLQKGKLFIQSAWEKKAIVYSLCTWKGRSPSYSVRTSIHHASESESLFVLEKEALLFTMHQRGGVLCSPCIREGVSCVHHASERGCLVFTMHQRGGILCSPCIREGVSCVYHASERGGLCLPCIREGCLVCTMHQRGCCIHHASERGCLVFTMHQRGGVLCSPYIREGVSCI